MLSTGVRRLILAVGAAAAGVTGALLLAAAWPSRAHAHPLPAPVPLPLPLPTVVPSWPTPSTPPIDLPTPPPLDLPESLPTTPPVDEPTPDPSPAPVPVVDPPAGHVQAPPPVAVPVRRPVRPCTRQAAPRLAAQLPTAGSVRPAVVPLGRAGQDWTAGPADGSHTPARHGGVELPPTGTPPTGVVLPVPARAGRPADTDQLPVGRIPGRGPPPPRQPPDSQPLSVRQSGV